MRIYVISFLLFFYCSLSGMEALFVKKGETKESLRKIINPSNTEIVFDLHGTLVQEDFWSMSCIVIKNPLTCLGFGLTVAAELLLYGWNGPTTSRINKRWGQSYEGYQEEFKNSDPKLTRVIKQLAMQHKPTRGMEQLLNDLKKKKYSIRIATDAGYKNFIRIQQKKELKSLFSYIQGGQAVDYGNKKGKESNTQTIIKTTKYPKALRDGRYFQDFEKQSSYQTKHRILVENDEVYIEDALNSEKSSFKAGILIKSIMQIRKALNSFGIKVPVAST